MKQSRFSFKLNGLQHVGVPDLEGNNVSITGPYMEGIFDEMDFKELYEILRQVFWEFKPCECGGRLTGCVCGQSAEATV